jgi:hypothetical protein
LARHTTYETVVSMSKTLMDRFDIRRLWGQDGGSFSGMNEFTENRSAKTKLQQDDGWSGMVGVPTNPAGEESCPVQRIPANASFKLKKRQPRTASILPADHLRSDAIAAGIVSRRDATGFT